MKPLGLENIKGGDRLLAAYEDIRQYGIREARAAHMCRLKLCRTYHSEPMFAAAIYPADTVEEALEDAKEFVRRWRRMSTLAQGSRYTRMLAAKERIAVCRYLRRYGARVWSRRAA